MRTLRQALRCSRSPKPPKMAPFCTRANTLTNALTLNALPELLTENGPLTQAEILGQIKKLQSETKVSA